MRARSVSGGREILRATLQHPDAHFEFGEPLNAIRGFAAPRVGLIEESCGRVDKVQHLWLQQQGEESRVLSDDHGQKISVGPPLYNSGTGTAEIIPQTVPDKNLAFDKIRNIFLNDVERNRVI
jgi:hypothetical protein